MGTPVNIRNSTIYLISHERVWKMFSIFSAPYNSLWSHSWSILWLLLKL